MDEPARPEELRWKITRTIDRHGFETHTVDGPCIRYLEVVPASVVDELREALAYLVADFEAYAGQEAFDSGYFRQARRLVKDRLDVS